VHAIIDDFLRRYATSPIHVPRLERMLHAYGDGESEEAFASRFIEWDRACPHGEAARIVSEVLSDLMDDTGNVRRVSDDAVRGAIRWVAEGDGTLSERVALLQNGLRISNPGELTRCIEWLERAATLPAIPHRWLEA
jgi:hypothetical protein